MRIAASQDTEEGEGEEEEQDKYAEEEDMNE
jgi:hypothetical protein